MRIGSYTDSDLTAIIDADLQDPPEEIVSMLDKWRNGFDVIYGVRKKRKEPWFLRLAYFTFYRLVHFLSGGMVPKDSGDFCLLDQKVVKAIAGMNEKIGFIRGVRAWVGFRQIAHEYERQKRHHGKSKYNFVKLYRLATDGVVSASIRPLKITQLLSILFFTITAFSGILGLKLLFTAQSGDTVVLMLSLLVIISSLTGFSILFCLYIISAYIGRMYLEVKSRPKYIVRESFGESSE